MGRILFAAVALVASLTGCASRPDAAALTPLPSPSPVIRKYDDNNLAADIPLATYVLVSRDVRLSLHDPVATELKLRLVSIARDATTVIQLDSGEKLSAHPGGYYACDQFGRSGLQLLSASPETGTAVFRRTRCESQ